jgi:hypothetical protein
VCRECQRGQVIYLPAFYKFKLINLFSFFLNLFAYLDSIYISLLNLKISKKSAVPFLRKKGYDFDNFVTLLSLCDKSTTTTRQPNITYFFN